MRLYSLCFVAVTGGLTLGAASTTAATVTWTLEAAGGSFDLFAEASLDDNFGIASYNILLDGDFTSIDHRSPAATFFSGPFGAGPAGFTLFRSANGNPAIGASQDTIAPTPNLVRGFGQTAGELRTLSLLEPVTWNPKLLVARGTYTGGQPRFSDNQIEFFTNVFSAATGVATEPAQLNLRVVPEPASFGLAALAVWAATCLTTRRKRLVVPWKQGTF